MMNEAAVQSHTRNDFAYIGPVWRNNSGACEDKSGRIIRYGLGNDSKKLNDKIKSSDLIAITPLLITPAWIGYTVGVFTALECKPEGWHLTPGDDRGHAQAKFHDIVRSVGGFAGFVSHPSDIHKIIRR